MMARRGALGTLAGALAAVVGGCGQSGTSSYRFRMTVEVETPQGLRTGSSVYEVVAYQSPKLTSEEKAGGGGVRGQAASVVVPSGVLFALLGTPIAGESLGSVATVALQPEAGTGRIADYVAAVHSLGGWFGTAKAQLPRGKWPIFVRFSNPSEPTSVELVDPEAAGVRRIVVETTHDDVTTGIENKLTWLGADPLTLGSNGQMGPPIAGGYLNNRSFWSGREI